MYYIDPSKGGYEAFMEHRLGEHCDGQLIPYGFLQNLKREEEKGFKRYMIKFVKFYDCAEEKDISIGAEKWSFLRTILYYHWDPDAEYQTVFPMPLGK